MIETLLKNIQNGTELRQNLSTLRKEIKDEWALEKCREQAHEIREYLEGLLEQEDAKTRKNAALLLGDLAFEESVEPLFMAYCREEQLFVKSAYLTALQNLDYTPYLPQLKEHLAELLAKEGADENRKHVAEETATLTALIIKAEGIKKHEFCGQSEMSDLILLTNRSFSEVTRDQIHMGQAKTFRAGVRVKTNQLDEILAIRTYNEMLFLVPGMLTCSSDPLEAARKVAESEILRFLEKRHTAEAPYYFRIEIKSKMPLDKKSILAKKMASEIENLTGRKLINSPSQYEIELRFIEHREGGFNILLKLYTIPDNRFTYRTEHTAHSIRPVNAALLTALAREYMIDNARVLDPFCGVGTMLIERQKMVKANTSYGLDILQEAIDKAKINTEQAGQIIHYINRDFFDFTHEYPFDEIFTNMPFETARKSEEEIYQIYDKFFDQARSVLTEEGTIIMYSHNRGFVERLTREKGYKIIRKIEVLKKEDTWLFVIK